MRFVVLGAGAVGGAVGGRLAQHGHQVVLIARGAHCEAIQRNGLTLESPDGAACVAGVAVCHPSKIEWAPVMWSLATKTSTRPASTR